MPKKPPFPIPDVSRTPQNTVAAILGVSRQTVAAWDCPRNGDSTYDLKRVIQWRLAFIEAQCEAAGDGPRSKELERLRHIQAEREQIKLDIDRGELVKVADVEHEWGLVLSRLRMHLVHLPNTIRAGLDPTAANTVIPVIEREVKSALDAVVLETDKEENTNGNR